MRPHWEEHFRQIRWEKVWVSIPESRYVQTPEEADKLAELLEAKVRELRQVAKRKRDAGDGS